jgi:hypothetical protein
MMKRQASEPCPTISFEQLIEIVSEKLPGAVLVNIEGAIIRAVSRKGKTRIVAVSCGVDWPKDFGASNKYDLISKQFVGIPIGGKYGIFGKFRSRYMSEIHPRAVAQVESMKYERYGRSNELLDGSAETGFKFRPKSQY